MTQPSPAAPPRTRGDGKQGWIDAFRSQPGDPRWLDELRRDAIAHFGAVGFPTTRDEEWKYTSVAAIEGTDFHAHDGAPQRQPDGADGIVGDISWARLVFVDGAHGPELKALPTGVQTSCVASLAGALILSDVNAERELGRVLPFEMNGFVALNTAFFRDGAFLSIPDGVALAQPIHLIHRSSDRPLASASHPRNLVILGARSSATIVETYVGSAEGRSLTNAVTEVVLGEGAVLTHCKSVSGGSQAYHVGSTAVRQARGSLYTSMSLSAGSALARHDLRVTLREEGAECTLLGLYLVRGSEHVDNHTAIDHAAPHGTSRQLYKGILDGHGRAVFSGKILVRPGSQQTDAHQANRNLLLSPDATVDTKPQLEILADDVKCSHGATVGQLDPEMLFYLNSRGLGGAAAQALLTYGFAAEVIERVRPESLRTHLADRLANRLGTAPLRDHDGE